MKLHSTNRHLQKYISLDFWRRVQKLAFYKLLENR